MRPPFPTGLVSVPLTEMDEQLFNRLMDPNQFKLVFKTFADDTCKISKAEWASESVIGVYATANDFGNDQQLLKLWNEANPEQQANGASWQVILKQFDSVSKFSNHSKFAIVRLKLLLLVYVACFSLHEDEVELSKEELRRMNRFKLYYANVNRSA
jgi:hypothetical protein